MSGQIAVWEQAMLTGRARELAAEGQDQEAIAGALAEEFPGQPSENHYLVPAAIAVMERIRSHQREAERDAAHAAWRRSKGMPEPAAADGPATGEPDEAAIGAIGNGRALLLLCRRYGIQIGWDEVPGLLRTSRPIADHGPLAKAIERFRPSLIKQLTAERAP